ncbi:hypothetical protein HDU81_006763 [Chytriomyces hyalinus]|nr:hypothetical protein HDU81_006763 [Chytriomyces hyalinus]
MQSVLPVFKRYPDISTPDGFPLKAAKLGWKEVVKIMVDGGFHVSEDYVVLSQTVSSDDCEMVEILLQDRRVDLSMHDYVLCQASKSVEMAKTLFSDKGIPNGKFLISICQGDIEAVTNHPALSETDLNGVKALWLFLAVHFNQSVVLQVLLSKEQFKHYSYEPVASENWALFRKLFNEDQSALCVTNWFILQILSSKCKFNAPCRDLFNKFTSECGVRDVMSRHQKWEFLLEMAFLFESRVLFEFVFTNAGAGNKINIAKVTKQQYDFQIKLDMECWTTWPREKHFSLFLMRTRAFFSMC